MNIIDEARKTVVEIPASDTARARLSLALDYTSKLERQVKQLQLERGGLQARLAQARFQCDELGAELQRVKDEKPEEIRIHHSIEFRRSRRTGGRWVPFCPKCHLPAASKAPSMYLGCADSACGWSSDVRLRDLPLVLEQLELRQEYVRLDIGQARRWPSISSPGPVRPETSARRPGRRQPGHGFRAGR